MGFGKRLPPSEKRARPHEDYRTLSREKPNPTWLNPSLPICALVLRQGSRAMDHRMRLPRSPGRAFSSFLIPATTCTEVLFLRRTQSRISFAPWTIQTVWHSIHIVHDFLRPGCSPLTE